MSASPAPFLFDAAARADRPNVQTPAPLPMTAEEMQERGWDEVDVVFITGDAYVDHPSFAAGLLARVVEADGFRVAVLSQPDWNDVVDFRRFGRPRVAFCVSAGNMDSMLNHYTANRKIRNNDAYAPGGKIGKRPDRATLAYCQRARQAFPGVPILTGGVEASLRRLAHYDYWSDKVRRSIALDSKCDLLIYGMGERPLLEVLRRLAAGEEIGSIRDVRGTVYRLGRNEDLPEESATIAHLPSFEEVEENSNKGKMRFVKMTQLAYENLNPYRAKTLVQEHGDEAIVVNPPSFPLSTEEMDAVYDLPYTRKPHPSYDEPIPAVDVVRASVQSHRGCFGGCSFCAITAHQGKFIQNRSEASILKEIRTLAEEAGGDFVVADLSAPTANMRGMAGKDRALCERCVRSSCLCPTLCPNLDADHTAIRSLMKKARETEGVKSVYIASGIRTDLANLSPEFVGELATHHVGGHLKTAPEHVDDDVLRLMNKPQIGDYEQFCELFADATEAAGKEQYLVPYLIAGFPGCTIKAMVAVAEYLRDNGIEPEQVQDFIPAPFQPATCAYYTGIDPITEKQIYVPRGLRERRLQRALLHYYNPEFYHDVKSALKAAKREDLIGDGPNALIPAYPPKASALRQTSRVKRLKRKEEREKALKEQQRQTFESKQGNERGGKRFGRATSGGGYRAGAREFGRDGGGFRRDFNGERREGGFKRDFDRNERREGGFKRDFDRNERREGGFRRDFNGERREGGFKRDFNRDGERGGFKRDFNGERRDGGFKRDFNRDGERGGFKRDFNGERREGGFKRDFNGERREGGFKRDFDRNERRDGGFKRDFNRDGERGGFKRDFNRNERREGGFKREERGGWMRRDDRNFRNNRNDRNDRGGFRRRDDRD
ncbi:MAG: YgiQ family radical SAM protein [Thermoguttaceae bacterium]|nr:YgiQ family radical SAM protein [Thermoguttaceae bacterium]